MASDDIEQLQTLLNELRYEYQTQLTEGCVRFLQISHKEAGSHEEPVLSCQLSTYDISECPPYIALSYAWHEPLASRDGDEAGSMLVDIDGHDISVTPNLYYALQYLASHQAAEKNNFYWIDALCINQSNDDERTSQVAIMHHIYQNAEKVLVWLGPDHGSEAYFVLEFFRALLQKYFDRDDRFNDRDVPRHYRILFLHDVDNETLVAEGLPRHDTEIWKAVVRFWDLAWFTRAWVQQEVGLARRVEFRCGEIEFRQFEIVEMSRFFIMSGLGITLLSLRTGSVNKLAVGRGIGQGSVRIHDLRLWAAGVRYDVADDFVRASARIGGSYLAVGQGEAFTALRLFTILIHKSYRTYASDPKDKVFALLVLMKKLAEVYQFEEVPIKIDYSQNTEEVFRRATGWIMEESGWIGILCLLQPWRRLVDVSDDWPSWVPDFTGNLSPNAVLENDLTIVRRVDDHYAFLTPENSPAICGKHLSVSMKRIGVVAEVGDSFFDMADGGYFEKTARLLLNYPERSNSKGKTRIDVWIDLFAGRSNDRPVLDDEREDFNQWLTFFILRGISNDYQAGRIKCMTDHWDKMPSFVALAKSDATGTVPGSEKWASLALSDPNRPRIWIRKGRFTAVVAEHRRLIRITDLGFPHCPSAQSIGIGPDDTQVGDEICQVAGTSMPLILRRQNGHQNSPPRCDVRVVGESFVWHLDEVIKRLEDEPWQRYRIW